MELDVKDRIVLLSILPKEGSLTTIRQLRELRENLSFSDEESASVDMHEEDGHVFWNGLLVKDVVIGPRMLTLILDEFEALDKNGRFKDEMLDTYEKFEAAK